MNVPLPRETEDDIIELLKSTDQAFDDVPKLERGPG